MASIWIFLLDRSGSMGCGFESIPPTSHDPLSEYGDWRSKLDAAKDVLARQASRINPQQEIAIIAFDGSHQEVYRGHASAFNKSILDSIKAGSNTDLSGALDGITSQKSYRQYESISLLVISDGLPDDLGAAVNSAEKLIRALPSTRIDVILIDNTKKGRSAAEAVAINGAVTYAYSFRDVQKQAKSAQIAGLAQQLRATVSSQFKLQHQLSLLTGMPSVATFSVPAITSISSANLRAQVVPLIEAIESIEQTRCDITQSAYAGRIHSISTSSPLKISTAGLAETIRAIVDFVTPRGRELRYRERELEQEMRELEVERKKQELELERNIEDRRQQDHQRQEELHRIELQQRRIAVQLQTDKYRLARSLYGAFAEAANVRDNSDPETYISRLAHDVDKLLRLDLEIETVPTDDI